MGSKQRAFRKNVEMNQFLRSGFQGFRMKYSNPKTRFTQFRKNSQATDNSFKSWKDYFMSTHFWGPAANWGIPIAAMADCRKSPEIISPNMTGSLIIYSTLFARFAWMVTPRNMLLLACHLTNLTLQCVQMGRYYEYEHLGGKEKLAAERAAAKAAEVAVAEPIAVEETKSE